MQTEESISLYSTFNFAGVVVAYGMLGLSVWLAPVDLSTKGFWGMGIFLLTLSLVNFVKYRIDARASKDRINQLEAAKTEKILANLEKYSKQALPFAHPFYWAGFTLIGDDKPIVEENWFQKNWWMLVIGLVLLLGIYAVLRKYSSSART